MTLPNPYEDVMITYKKTIRFGDYQSKSREEIVTKRGFYNKLFNNFAIPPEYQSFNGRLMPHGFGGDHIPADSNKIIKWEEIK
jgi:hypothetical protein